MNASEQSTASHPLQVCFVIPTYNEADNITPLLQKLRALYPDANTMFLIVDDDSPDGTADRVRAVRADDARVHLLQGQRRGLGDAYIRGITHALEALRADVVVQMDADFSHDPAAAGELITRVAAGEVEVAIGSRYVAGGDIDSKWSAARRWLSLWGNRMARWIAGIRTVHDCTAGFKAIAADALRRAALQNIRVQGYAFQVVLLSRLLDAGARVAEVPVYFREREHGQTKLGLRDLCEFFLNIWWLRVAKHRIFFRFAVTGVIGAVVNLGAFAALLAAGVHQFVASPIAIEISIISNFLFNNYWTFAERDLVGRKRIRLLKFNLVSLAALVVNYAVFIGLSFALPAAWPVLLQAAAILPAAVVNYFVNTRWTFREG